MSRIIWSHLLRDIRKSQWHQGAIASALVALGWLAIGRASLTGDNASELFLLFVVLVLVVWIAVRDVQISWMSDRLWDQTGESGQHIKRAYSPLGRLRGAIEAAVRQLAANSHRLPQRHPSTGAPTREVLIDAINSSRPINSSRDERARTFLGVIEVLDFERLSGFDANGAEHLIKTIVERIVAMLGPTRVFAQVDRGRFAIWFNSTPVAEAQQEFRALCYALQNRVTFDTVNFLPQFACGSAEENDDAINGVELLARAIADLASGNRLEVVDEQDPLQAAQERFRLEQDLRTAIDRREFELAYQPFISAAQNRVCGAEALLRWQSPTHGPVPPSQFIPIVEAAGLAENVGLWVLNKACEDATRWHNHGLSNMKVAVNLSASQLGRADFASVIQRMLKVHQMPSSALELELTETVAAGNGHGIVDLFERLRTMGISISIDDFGTGYSSLSYLKKLRFDKLKIDREFVTDVDSQRDSQAICQSIIALGRGLGIEVLAEGVERWEEYAWLRRHGCALFQGYYFSKPLPLKAFIAFARQGARVAGLLDVGPAALRGRVGEKL